MRGRSRRLVGREGMIVLITFAALAITVGAMSATAHAVSVVAGTSTGVLSGRGTSDFGSGTHVAGLPTGPYHVTWTYSVSGAGPLVVTAKVTGTLYLDKLGGGCARLRVIYKDEFSGLGNTLHEGDHQFCGPGFDANNSANQLAVSDTFTFTTTRSIQLVVGSGPSLGSIIDDNLDAVQAVGGGAVDIIEDGAADFGSGLHLNGSPTGTADIGLDLSLDTLVHGNVTGTLYWDSTSAGCARMFIDFLDENSAVLHTTGPIDECGAQGGNALVNQRAINVLFNAATLFQIRLRIGVASGATGIVGQKTRTYGFAGLVGTVEGIPEALVAHVGEPVTYGVQWTVPDPQNWHSLNIMGIRIMDDTDVVLQLRWDEATNTFQQLSPSGRVLKSGLPGSNRRFFTTEATLSLAGTSVVGSGPSGPSVTLNLDLQFRPEAAGRTLRIEASARDDSGNVQGWNPAGVITVLPDDSNEDEQ